MEKAEWDASAKVWRIETRDVRTGESRVTHATALISAIGVLAVPKFPDLKGIESFKGEVFHSARWRHDIDLHGKRVGVLGNGSSACVVLPFLDRARCATSLYQIPVYPNYIQRSHCPRSQFRTH